MKRIKSSMATTFIKPKKVGKTQEQSTTETDIYCGDCRHCYFQESLYIDKRGYKCKIDTSVGPSWKGYRSSNCMNNGWKT